MSSIPPQLVQLECPNCNNPFRSNVYSLIEAVAEPELKQALLAGRINVAVCPACGTPTMIATALVYHDVQKQVCFVYMPQEMNLSPEEQERIIGNITNAIITNLPANAPRGYLLMPRRFMTIVSMVDAILEADGVPREVVEQQRTRVDLISKLAEALINEEQFNHLVKQYKSELNQDFFATLTAFIEASLQENRQDSAQILMHLRNKLAELTGFADDASFGTSEAEVNQVIDHLIAIPDAELENAIAEVRPVIDYGFFQAWTARIEALEQEGKTDEAKRLTDRRTRVLELVERMDKEAQELYATTTEVLRDVLSASDPKAVLHAHKDYIGEAFMMVLSANIEAAQQAGQQEMVKRLEEISHLAIELIQSQLPPEERFINELLLAGSPEQSSQLLRQNASMVTTDFVKKLNELAADQEKRGLKDSAKILRQLAREAGAMLY